MPRRPRSFAAAARLAVLAFSTALAALAALPPLAAQAAPPAQAEKPAPPWQGKLSSCALADASEAFCGTYEVFENRETLAGRKIFLRIVVLPALGADRAPDPLFFLEGGPGGAAIPDAEIFVKDRLRQHRDIVLVDTRGTGDSNPLACPVWGDGTRLDHIFPLDAVTACRDELKQRADLTQYTTSAAMDDLDEVRRYLGYGKVNLYGASYGTFAAQIFLARHPEAVRSVVLAAVVKPGEPAPLYHARNAQQALELLASECAAEAACHNAFPNVRAELTAVLDRLAKQPAKVQVKHPTSGQPVTVELTRSAAADALRWALYSPEPASQVPLRIHLAYQGDYTVLAQTAVRLRAQLQQYLTLGLLFSVSCAEDLPLIDPALIPEATRGSFYGDDRVREQLAVCGVWPHAPLPKPWGERIHSDVPALLLSGERDPVTPPAEARWVAAGFPNGRLILIPHGAHATEGECTEGLIADFVERGSAQGLDASCLKAEPPRPFVLTPPAEPPAPPAAAPSPSAPSAPGSGAAPGAVAAAAPDFELQKLAEGVYAAIRTYPPGLMCDGNSVFLIDDDGVVVVDAPEASRDMLAALRRLTDKPVRAVINTHWHDDHITGNAVYRDAFPGVEFIGHPKMLDYLPTTGAANRKGMIEGAPGYVAYLQGLMKEGKSPAGGELTTEERRAYESDARLVDRYMAEVPRSEMVLPTRTATDRLVLQRGKRTIEVLHLGAGHTEADLVVWLPQEGIAVSGDLVVWPVPLVGHPQSKVTEWGATLEKLLALHPKAIVPGHGPVLRDESYTRQMIDLFAAIVAQVRAAAGRGETLEQARKSVDLGSQRRLFAGDSKLRGFLFDRYVAGPAVESAYAALQPRVAKAGG